MKTVLITGASSGIGKETAFVYARNNFDLVLVARREEQLESIKIEIEKKYSVSVAVISMDLSQIESALLLYTKIKDMKICIDVLINNAGFGVKGDFKDTDTDKEEQMLILNMITLTKLTKYFLNDMLRQNSGLIINIASTAAFQGIPKFSTYAATKAYVLHFSEAIAVELRNTNVKIKAICPGPTNSEFAKTANANGSKAFRNIPEASEVAEFIYKSGTNSKTTIIYGIKNKLMVFSQRFAPRDISTIIAGKFMQ